jgi:hypothetical protein
MEEWLESQRENYRRWRTRENRRPTAAGDVAKSDSDGTNGEGTVAKCRFAVTRFWAPHPGEIPASFAPRSSQSAGSW